MKRIITIFFVLFSILSFGQSEDNKDILINKVQDDDVYLAGETIKVKAVIKGDLVSAGGNLIIKDSILGDFTGVGGEILLEGHILDDVRIAGGKVNIDSDVGDDLVIFGGEVIIEENTQIKGKLVCFAGDVIVNGEVIEALEVRGGNVTINGTIRGKSKIIGEDLIIGSNAKFHNDIEYWSSDGEIDFKNSLVNADARFNNDFRKEKSQFSLTTLGTTSMKLWVYYILSAFLIILVLHTLFKAAFSNAVEDLDKNLLKSFGFGLVYLLGIPFLILLAFLMIIGIPLGLFATGVFVFSLLFGHLVAALLFVYYINHKHRKNWGFWNLTFMALLCAIILRVLTIIPFAGILISAIILSITYGAFTVKILQSKKQLV